MEVRHEKPKYQNIREDTEENCPSNCKYIKLITFPYPLPTDKYLQLVEMKPMKMDMWYNRTNTQTLKYFLCCFLFCYGTIQVNPHICLSFNFLNTFAGAVK